MTQPTRFAESDLLPQLERLQRRLRSAFAAAAAQRLVLACNNLRDVRTGADVAAYLDDLWAELTAFTAPVTSWNARIHQCETAMPPDDELPGWTPAHGLASDAAAAVAYALRSWRDDSARDSAWCASVVAEALERRSLPEGLSLYQPADSLPNRVLEEELRRQRRDMAHLANAIAGSERAVLEALRATATAEGLALVNELP